MVKRTLGESRRNPPNTTPSGNQLFLRIFTSGSTGAPKAVKMTQGRAIEQMAGAAAVYTPGDVLYSTMPMFHANALTGSLFPALSSGASVVLKRRLSASASCPMRGISHDPRSITRDSLRTSWRSHPPPRTLTMHSSFASALKRHPAIRGLPPPIRVLCREGYTSSEGGVAINPFRGMPEEALGLPRQLWMWRSPIRSPAKRDR